MIGHNRGPSMEAGFGFRKAAWTKARRALLPSLPLEVVRLHVARAKRLGLPYQTYATIRATSGRDIVAFLFSGNALELTPQRVRLPENVAARLEALPAEKIAAVYAPTHPKGVLQANTPLLEHAFAAPRFTESWSELRTRLGGAIRDCGVPKDGVVLVAATAVEREWCGAADMAGIISAERFFGSASA